jgi:hypothetical protein
MLRVILGQFKWLGTRSRALSTPFPQLKTDAGFVLRYRRLQATLQKMYWQEVFIPQRIFLSQTCN